MSAVAKLANPHRIKAAHRRRWKCSTGHRVYANNNPVRFTDPTGRCVDAQFGCGAQGQTIASHPEAFAGAAPYAAAAAGVLAIAPIAVVAVEAAIANPVAAANLVNGAAEALAGDALGGASLAGGAIVAGKAAKGASTALSETRLTQAGESFIRYESANPAFSRVTSQGGVTAGTFAAPASDGLVPVAQRISAYNLPSPNIPRTNYVELRPPAGTPIVGPRTVVGGTGNEVIFPEGF